MYDVAARASSTPQTRYPLSGYNTRYGYPACGRAIKHGLITCVGTNKRGEWLYIRTEANK